MKTFQKFRQDSQLIESNLKESKSRIGKACPKCGSRKHDGFISPDFESVHCSKCNKCYQPGNGPKPYTERFLTRAECLKAFEEGIKDGTIRVCEACGSPNLAEIQKFGMTCVDCGIRTNGIVPYFPKKVNENELEEDGGAGGGSGGGAGAGSGASGGLGAGVNCAGSGNIAGIGVGPQGEPGVYPEYQRKRKQLGVVGPPVVDPRMFADKIFNHGKGSPKPVTESEHHDLLVQHGFVDKGNGKFVHPEGHEATVSELKGRSWTQSMPAHQNPKVFKQQLQKLLKQKATGGPKAGQSAMPDSKGNFRKVK